MVRKSKKGTVRSVFLSEENSDYVDMVYSLFQRSLGKKRGEIENEISELELKVQNPKIIKGLAVLLFRLSKLKPPSHLNAPEIRNIIFSSGEVPVISPESREMLLKKIAEKFHTSIIEIQEGMYSDKESEQVLEYVPDVPKKEIIEMFNAEQVETVLLKAVSMKIRADKNREKIIRILRRNGLLYLIKDDLIEVSGPLSINEHTERYGSNFSMLIRKMMKLDGWTADATVRLKDGDGKKDYNYTIESSFSEYIGTNSPEKINNFMEETEPISAGNLTIYPDYSIEINNKRIFIFITRPRYFEEDNFLVLNMRKEGFEAEIICILNDKDRCPKGALCFKDEIEWDRVLDFLKNKYSKWENVLINETNRRNITSNEKEKVIAHLNKLYPDTEAMIDYLEFMGLDIASTLTEAGFKVNWKGLRMIISK